jgi:hypothetical protein
VEVEENAEPETATRKSEEEELACARNRDNREKLTGADGFVQSRQRFIGIDPNAPVYRNRNRPDILMAYSTAGMALAWSPFAVVNKSRLRVLSLLLRGHETAIPGRLGRERGDSVVIEEEIAIDEVEESKNEVEVEEKARKPVENELALGRI